MILVNRLTLYLTRHKICQNIYLYIFLAVVVCGFFTVAVDITKMISDRGYPTVGSRHFIRYKYHHSVLPPC